MSAMPQLSVLGVGHVHSPITDVIFDPVTCPSPLNVTNDTGLRRGINVRSSTALVVTGRITALRLYDIAEQLKIISIFIEYYLSN